MTRAHSAQRDGGGRIAQDRLFVEFRPGFKPPNISEVLGQRHLLGDLWLLFSADAKGLKTELEREPDKYGLVEAHGSLRSKPDVLRSMFVQLANEATALPETPLAVACHEFPLAGVSHLYELQTKCPGLLRQALQAQDQELRLLEPAEVQQHRVVNMEPPWHLTGAFGVGVERGAPAQLIPDRPDVLVAVIDSGIDHAHPALAPVMWRRQGAVADGLGRVDPLGPERGFVDDVHGINALIRETDGTPTGSVMDPLSGHGTQVAGIIAGKPDAAHGYRPVSRHAKLLAIRAVPENLEFDEDDGDIAEAFLYAAEQGAKIINCSFAKRTSSDVVARVLEHIADKALIVAAAGNNGRPLAQHKVFPAAFGLEHILVVTSTGTHGGLTTLANFGEGVHLAAPGRDIRTTLSGGRFRQGAHRFGDTFSGTSAAAAIVSGVAAEVLWHFPSLSPLQLKEALCAGPPVEAGVGPTAEAADDERPWDGPRVHLGRALERARMIDAVNQAAQELEQAQADLATTQAERSAAEARRQAAEAALAARTAELEATRADPPRGAEPVKAAG